MAALSDLDLEILDSDGTVLALSMNSGFDVSEQIMLTLDAGSYFARVTGRDDAAQFYSLTLSGISAVPEPATGALLLGMGGAMLLRRRR